jgi:hypothetical protein
MPRIVGLCFRHCQTKKPPLFIGLFHDPGIFGLTQGLRSTPSRWAFLFVRGLKACKQLFQAQFRQCMLSPLPNKKAPSAFAEKALCPGLKYFKGYSILSTFIHDSFEVLTGIEL